MQQKNVRRSVVSQNYSIPAPTGGLNVRDNLDEMPETDAIVMDNYIPMDNKVVLRKGYQKYVVTDEAIKTLMTYKLANNCHFLASGGGNFYDVSSKLNVIKYEKEFFNDDWQYCQFRNRLIMVNGTDTPQTYYIEDNQTYFQDLQVSGDGLFRKN